MEEVGSGSQVSPHPWHLLRSLGKKVFLKIIVVRTKLTRAVFSSAVVAMPDIACGTIAIVQVCHVTILAKLGSTISRLQKSNLAIMSLASWMLFTPLRCVLLLQPG